MVYLKLLIDKSKATVVIVKAVLTFKSVLYTIGLIYLSKMPAKYDYQNQTSQPI